MWMYTSFHTYLGARWWYSSSLLARVRAWVRTGGQRSATMVAAHREGLRGEGREERHCGSGGQRHGAGCCRSLLSRDDNNQALRLRASRTLARSLFLVVRVEAALLVRGVELSADVDQLLLHAARLRAGGQAVGSERGG